MEEWNNDQGCFFNSFPNIPVLQHSNDFMRSEKLNGKIQTH